MQQEIPHFGERKKIYNSGEKAIAIYSFTNVRGFWKACCSKQSPSRTSSLPPTCTEQLATNSGVTNSLKLLPRAKNRQEHRRKPPQKRITTNRSPSRMTTQPKAPQTRRTAQGQGRKPLPLLSKGALMYHSKAVVRAACRRLAVPVGTDGDAYAPQTPRFTPRHNPTFADCAVCVLGVTPQEAVNAAPNLQRRS